MKDNAIAVLSEINKAKEELNEVQSARENLKLREDKISAQLKDWEKTLKAIESDKAKCKEYKVLMVKGLKVKSDKYDNFVLSGTVLMNASGKVMVKAHSAKGASGVYNLDLSKFEGQFITPGESEIDRVPYGPNQLRRMIQMAQPI